MVELIGPRPDGYDVVVDGYRVPYLTAHPVNPQDQADSAAIELVLDRRFCITILRGNLHQIGWFLGQAMAVAAGYSSLGPHAQPMNRFQVQVAEMVFPDGISDDRPTPLTA